jgi:hypothetical protein
VVAGELVVGSEVLTLEFWRLASSLATSPISDRVLRYWRPHLLHRMESFGPILHCVDLSVSHQAQNLAVPFLKTPTLRTLYYSVNKEKQIKELFS